MDIERRSEPTKLDHAPKGTKCRVSIFPKMKNGEFIGPVEYETYIQINKDESNPIWELYEDRH